ncbi:MAG: hypothetical protein ABFD81_11300 [Syntrophaceae bacterium]
MMALLVAMLVFTLHGNPPVAEFLDFTFYDAANKEYHSTHVLEDMLLNATVRSDPWVVLIETSSLDHPDYVRQTGILQTISRQECDLLCVVACPSAEAQAGYHTDRDTACSLFEGEGHFRVVLLSSSGAVIKAWKDPVTARQLRRHLSRI